MTLVRGGDLFGLVVHLTHFYTILKLLLVPLVPFTLLVVEIASHIRSREGGYLYLRMCKSGRYIYHAACDGLDMR